MPSPTKKKSPKKAVDKSDQPIKFVVDSESAPERVYANWVSISNSPYDLTLDFCDVASIDENKLTDKGSHSELSIRSSVRVALTYEVFSALIEAMQSVKNKLDSKKGH